MGQNLVDAGFITTDQLASAGEAGRRSGVGLLETLVLDGLVPRETLIAMLSFQLRIPVIDLKTVDVDQAAVTLVPVQKTATHAR